VLNVERARLDKMLANNEITSLIKALGVGIEEQFDISGLRYPQDHHHDRRRRRRFAHPHATFDLLLPTHVASYSRADTYILLNHLYI
jgi:hypothetical protein